MKTVAKHHRSARLPVVYKGGAIKKGGFSHDAFSGNKPVAPTVGPSLSSQLIALKKEAKDTYNEVMSDVRRLEKEVLHDDKQNKKLSAAPAIDYGRNGYTDLSPELTGSGFKRRYRR